MTRAPGEEEVGDEVSKRRDPAPGLAEEDEDEADDDDDDEEEEEAASHQSGELPGDRGSR